MNHKKWMLNIFVFFQHIDETSATTRKIKVLYVRDHLRKTKIAIMNAHVKRVSDQPFSNTSVEPCGRQGSLLRQWMLWRWQRMNLERTSSLIGTASPLSFFHTRLSLSPLQHAIKLPRQSLENNSKEKMKMPHKRVKKG